MSISIRVDFTEKTSFSITTLGGHYAIVAGVNVTRSFELLEIRIWYEKSFFFFR